MGKLSIISLTLLSSILFFHAKGRTLIQSETQDQVEKWYARLHEKKLTTTKLKVFLHANNTVNQVHVAQSLVPIAPTFFGSVYAFEYTVTSRPDVKSEFLGYGRGFFVESSMGDFSVTMGINLSLNKYSNSTITLLGQDQFSDMYRELAVVGGNGDFRLATGSAIVSTMFYRVNDAAIIEVNIFVRHYLNV